MIWVVILVAFSSVSAFVCGDLTPGMHATTDEQEVRKMSQDGGGRERSIDKR